MANEVNFGYPIGNTLEFGVYTPTETTGVATERESGSTLTETPANSGLYLGTPAAISKGDQVIIKKGTVVVGHGEYNGKTMIHNSVQITRN